MVHDDMATMRTDKPLSVSPCLHDSEVGSLDAVGATDRF